MLFLLLLFCSYNLKSEKAIPLAVFVLFKMFFCYPSLFVCFHINVKIFFNFSEKLHWNFEEGFIEVVDCFR